MLSEVCKELNNWFDVRSERLHGAFEISGGRITDSDFSAKIQPNQYFRIIGSVFNDGVYKNDESLDLTDELFVGSVWFMKVPKDVIDLSDEIDEWIKKYEEFTNNPYSSESFGGYSYSKASGSNGSGNPTWQNTFSIRLNRWRKI